MSFAWAVFISTLASGCAARGGNHVPSRETNIASDRQMGGRILPPRRVSGNLRRLNQRSSSISRIAWRHETPSARRNRFQAPFRLRAAHWPLQISVFGSRPIRLYIWCSLNRALKNKGLCILRFCLAENSILRGRYSHWRSSCWLTRPTTYANSCTHLLSRMMD